MLHNIIQNTLEHILFFGDGSCSSHRHTHIIIFLHHTLCTVETGRRWAKHHQSEHRREKNQRKKFVSMSELILMDAFFAGNTKKPVSMCIYKRWFLRVNLTWSCLKSNKKERKETTTREIKALVVYYLIALKRFYWFYFRLYSCRSANNVCFKVSSAPACGDIWAFPVSIDLSEMVEEIATQNIIVIHWH